MAGALVPGRLGLVYGAWMAVARRLSKVTTPLVLGIVYYFLVTPLGILLHVSGRIRCDTARARAVTGLRVPSGGRSNVENQFRESEVMANAGVLGQLWAFLKVRKKWWLLPLLIVLLGVGGLLVFAQGSVLAPLIYPIF